MKKETKKDEKPLKGELSKAELDLLTKQYPKLKTLIFCDGDILDEGNKGVVYVKNFTRPLYEAILKLQDEKASKLTQAEWVLRNLRVGGMTADEIINDIDWLKNFANVARALFFTYYGDIKKNL